MHIHTAIYDAFSLNKTFYILFDGWHNRILLLYCIFYDMLCQDSLLYNAGCVCIYHAGFTATAKILFIQKHNIFS